MRIVCRLPILHITLIPGHIEPTCKGQSCIPYRSCLRLQGDAEDFKPLFDESFTSGIQRYERAPVRGLQYFSSTGDEDVVGKPYRHVAADMQVRHDLLGYDAAAAARFLPCLIQFASSCAW
jgi:hypothetical protein